MPPRDDEAQFIQRFIASIRQLTYGDAKQLRLRAKRLLREAEWEQQRRIEKFFDQYRKGTMSYPEYYADRDRDYVPGVGGRIYYLTMVVKLCELTMESRQEDAALLAMEVAKALRHTLGPSPVGDLNPTPENVPIDREELMGELTDRMVHEEKAAAAMLRAGKKPQEVREKRPEHAYQGPTASGGASPSSARPGLAATEAESVIEVAQPQAKHMKRSGKRRSRMPKYRNKLKPAIRDAWASHGREADYRTICHEVDERPIPIAEDEYPWPAPRDRYGLEARYDGPHKNKIKTYLNKIKRQMINAKQL